MDHERVNIQQSYMSCGIMELSRISEDSEGVLYSLGNRLYHPSRGQPCAFFIFSDTVEEITASSRLADAVFALKLGDVRASERQENPKTGNVITIYTWNIDHAAFKAWYAKKRVEKLGRVGA